MDRKKCDKTVKELRLEAKRKGHTGYYTMRKSELCRLLGYASFQRNLTKRVSSTRKLRSARLVEMNNNNRLFSVPKNIVSSSSIPSSLRLSYCKSSVQGLRPEMEDFYVAKRLGNNIYLYAVFDGHGGKQSASALVTILPEMLLISLSRININNSASVKRIIKQTFHDIDQTLYNLKVKKSGSTATGVLFIGSNVYVFNLGDSRTYVLDSTNNIQIRTKDHKPHNELARIQKAGGYVQKSTGRVAGVLIMSRAFGDFELETDKKPKGKRSIISSEPDVFHANMNQGRVIMASDGVWDVLKIDDIKKINKVSIRNLCQTITLESLRLGSTDNITVLVIDFNN